MTPQCQLLVSGDGMEYGEKDLVQSSVDFFFFNSAMSPLGRVLTAPL